jgi:hypothetical protein
MEKDNAWNDKVMEKDNAWNDKVMDGATMNN